MANAGSGQGLGVVGVGVPRDVQVVTEFYRRVYRRSGNDLDQFCRWSVSSSTAAGLHYRRRHFWARCRAAVVFPCPFVTRGRPMAFWMLAMVAATPSWWLADALMPFAGAVVACPSLSTLGTYPPASHWVAASCRCRTRRSVLGSRVPGPVRGYGCGPTCSARRSRSLYSLVNLA